MCPLPPNRLTQGHPLHELLTHPPPKPSLGQLVRFLQLSIVSSDQYFNFNKSQTKLPASLLTITFSDNTTAPLLKVTISTRSLLLQYFSKSAQTNFLVMLWAKTIIFCSNHPQISANINHKQFPALI